MPPQDLAMFHHDRYGHGKQPVRTSPLRLLVFMSAMLSPLVIAASVPAQDVTGSHDSPLVSRFAGSVIVGYAQKDYDSMVMPLGRFDRSQPTHFAASDTLEGKVTTLAYVVPPGKTTLEVYRNYERALTGAGFIVRFQCSGEAGCGGYNFAEASLKPVREELRGHRSLMIYTLQPITGDVRALTARLLRPEGNVDLSLMVSQNKKEPVGVLLSLVETKPMATGQVSVDAKAMGEGLGQAGHIALYGIQFASDSATLSKDSNDTLAQMASLLKAQPALKVHIVGHTDNTGNLAHNVLLSQQRAEAVVKALITRYGIASTRLAAKGIASYAPIASNHGDAGKARNRRVELVEQ